MHLISLEGHIGNWRQWRPQGLGWVPFVPLYLCTSTKATLCTFLAFSTYDYITDFLIIFLKNRGIYLDNDLN